jgi:hypothetical protein
MNLFVDTSVWSMAFRRSAGPPEPEVVRLDRALEAGEGVFTTGIVLQELLQGFTKPNSAEQIINRFSAIPFLAPERNDYIEAARLRNLCRRRGVQIATIDALLAQLCIQNELTMLSRDQDFTSLAELTPLELWRPEPPPIG